MKKYLIFVGIAFALVNCKQSLRPVNLDYEAKPAQLLSEYSFFKSPMNQLSPNERVIPYDLITPLFSDYARKARFIWIPEGGTAVLQSDDHIEYPTGTALIKNFYYPDIEDNGKRTIIETRLLVKRSSGWDALTYIWNESQTEAHLSIIGDTRQVSALDDRGNKFEIDYVIPDKNQCKNCHDRGRKISPLGPKPSNLNHEFQYDNEKKNQLKYWVENNLLQTPTPFSVNFTMTDWADTNAPLADRALSYLDVNCGSCHHSKGSAHISGLRLTVNEPNPFNLGVNKPPVSAGKGSGDLPFDIVPGDPDRSILLYRMQSTDPGAMMPEIGRKLVHHEGVQLIRDWIASM